MPPQGPPAWPPPPPPPPPWGQPPPAVVEEADKGKIQAEIDVASISIVGNRAIVSVDEGDTPEIWRMLRTDRWRVDDIVER